MDLAFDQRGFRYRHSLTGNLATLGLTPVQHIEIGQDLLAKRRRGMIVIVKGRLEAVYGRWWPHYGNALQVLLDFHLRRLSPDRCELYYHQPLGMPGFLTLSYVRSGPRTSLSSFYAATLVLDEIARIKRANAIVCHVTNSRISQRLLHRWGWQQHCLNWRGRHFIKRFYGDYPDISPYWRERLGLD